MLKAALEYITGLKEPKINEIRGDEYSDKPLYRIDTYFPKADRIHISTLTGLLDYILSGTDELPPKVIIEVASPTCVKMYSQLDPNRDREYIVEVNAMLPDFRFGQFIEHESFCINLQSKFIQNTDRDLLLKFAGTVKAGTIAEYGDDGVTQKATVKTGITSSEDAIVPNPVLLKPYRTFLEVEQPTSQFVFRMRDNRGVECAIFEADGGAWKFEAMQHIRDFLQERLAKYEQFTVIA